MLPVAYFRGRLVPRAELAIPVDDLGFVQGVTVSEQLRTFGGRLFRVEEHLARLARSLAIVGLAEAVSLAEVERVARDLVARNHPLLAPGDDLGVTVLVTPGAAQGPAAGPGFIVHTQPVAFASFAEKYESGESLVFSTIRQVPEDCWPAELKCRSRMHYFLADQEARRLEPGARALLLDQTRRVCEATTANVLVYSREEGLLSPPAAEILPGITLGVLAELARAEAIPFSHRSIWPLDVAAADEVMLASTSPCLLPVVRLSGQPIGDGRPGPIFRRLLAAFSREVGLDIAAQARLFAAR